MLFLNVNGWLILQPEEATLIDVTHDRPVSETMILKARHINYLIGREYDVEALANYISMRITPSNHLFSVSACFCFVHDLSAFSCRNLACA